MVNTFIWPVISSVASSILIAGVSAIWKSFHRRFDRIDEHLKAQDRRITAIERQVS